MSAADKDKVVQVAITGTTLEVPTTGQSPVSIDQTRAQEGLPSSL